MAALAHPVPLEVSAEQLDWLIELLSARVDAGDESFVLVNLLAQLQRVQFERATSRLWQLDVAAELVGGDS